jgi:hypothetical protein
MRTTLSIDQTVLREAKSLAARSGATLSAFVETAVREKLRKGNDLSAHNRRPMLVFPKTGGMMPGVDINNNTQMAELMDEWDALDRRQRADLRGPH